MQNPVNNPEPGLDQVVAFVRERLGNHWVIGAPLGLGKPNHLINALYRAAKAEPSIRLELFTALSLDPPKPGSGLRQRFLGPFLQRHFGDYPRLEYLADLDRGQVPGNIQISEFYFQSGSRMGNCHAQQHYLSSNYTHVARDMANRGVNLVLQMVARDPARPGHYSLSCNPDVTLDLLALVPREQLLVLLQVNDELPYMGGAAEIPAGLADLVVDQPQPLFAVPLAPVNDQDLMVGLHCSQLIRDGGTLQLGIGSLGDAVTCCSLLRHQENTRYRELLQATGSDWRVPAMLSRDWGGQERFERGLYAASEMLTEGFLHLYNGGVLQRRVYDHAGLQTVLNQGLLTEELQPDCLETLWQQNLLPRHLGQDSLLWLKHFGILHAEVQDQGENLRLPDGSSLPNDFFSKGQRDALAAAALGGSLKHGAVLHAAFFLGSKWMYRQLREMPAAERELFQMTAVSRINQLYRSEDIDRAQRQEARFINTTMKVTLLGAAVSDQLEHGQVVSGVGGQYNFVAMAQALDRARSVLMLRSFRGSGKDAVSNIVWEFPHTTIPRHLRDIVVTEYGAADLRSLEDHEVIQALICIADSRWQESLRLAAVKAGKLDSGWSVPGPYRNNTPEQTAGSLHSFRQSGLLKPFPFGSDFTPEEEQLAAALAYLQEHTQGHWNRFKLALRSLGASGKPASRQQAALARMGLESGTSPGAHRHASWSEWLEKRLLCLALKSTGAD
jgi:acyl-CoA hydrolase